MSFKVPVCRRHEYTLYLQDIEGTTWIHCDVFRWAASVSKRLRADVDTLVEMQAGPVLALNEGGDKHRKFLKLMGFGFFQTVPAKDGGECLIYRRG